MNSNADHINVSHTIEVGYISTVDEPDEWIAQYKKRLDTPTREVYEPLQHAYKYFNNELFDSSLPDCVLTVQRKSFRVFGYFSPGRFVAASAHQKCDEIALNPMRFLDRPTIAVFGTLVHEMCHLWQHHHGTQSRNGYHNREWGNKMKEVGLYPSHSGQPGGKETGDQMTHYIIEGGPFERLAKDLIDNGSKLYWHDPTGARSASIMGALILPTPSTSSIPPAQLGEPVVSVVAPLNRSNRVRYVCPACHARAWGKPALSLICGVCAIPLLPG